jgi:CTP synthase
MTRYIFITGGVVSSLGKGLASASLGALLQLHGYRVRLRKMDPYLNIDPGTMSPIQHGEVFVTDDGAETDLDIGHYERFTGVSAKRGDSISAGKIYETLLQKERRGDYLGGTVQVIPHVTDLIKDYITQDEKADNKDDMPDFVLCEIGGTVGDIEGLPFFEAIRQLRHSLGAKRVMFIHLTLVPYIAAAKELKTKPTQHSVKELRSIGIQPNILLCRCEKEIPDSERSKIALFCNLSEEAVIPAVDVKCIYSAPLALHQYGLDAQVLKYFDMPAIPAPDLSAWETVVERMMKPERQVRIAIVGKYVKLTDAYKSIVEALDHGGIQNLTHVQCKWVNARTVKDDNIAEKLRDIDGVIIPGGFGEEGIEGKIAAIRYARENNIPLLGICLGMQLSVIEAARNLVGLADASSSEFGECAHPVVALLTEWMKGDSLERRSMLDNMGGTMRLGSYPCHLKKDTLASALYDHAEVIHERHRHRYEVNNEYVARLEAAGMVFSGKSPHGDLPEIVEYANHPWFIGVQFHPELKSSPFHPHPLFDGLIQAAIKYNEQNG